MFDRMTGISNCRVLTHLSSNCECVQICRRLAAFIAHIRDIRCVHKISGLQGEAGVGMRQTELTRRLMRGSKPKKSFKKKLSNLIVGVIFVSRSHRLLACVESN